MGAGKALCITCGVLAFIGVVVVAILAFAPGAAITGALNDAREATPKGQDSESRRLVMRQALTGSDYAEALENQQVWGSGIQDFGGIEFHNVIACLLHQSAITDFVNEDWYSVSLDLGVCPSNQNGDGKDAQQILNGWVRVTQPSLFQVISGMQIEMMIYDQESGLPVYLNIRMKSDSDEENPFGDYTLTMIQEVPEDIAEEQGMSGMRMTMYTTVVEGKPTLFSTMTMEGLDFGGDEPAFDLSINTIFQFDQESGEGLFINDGFTMGYAMVEGEALADGCRVYSTIAFSPDYIYHGNPEATEECGLTATEVEESDWFFDQEQCMDVADYVEHCWEVVLFNEADGSAIEGRSVLYGGFENEDAEDEWSAWGWIACEVADNGNDTCCYIDGHNVTSDGPLVFDSYEADGIAEYTATAAAGDACSGGWWNFYDTQVVITDEDDEVIEFTPPFYVEYNHTQANDRNGVNAPTDGSFEYRPGGYNSLWYLGDGVYVKDGTLMGDQNQYIAMCPWIYQEFQSVDVENCDELPEASDALFKVEAPEPVEVPDDVPTDIPVVVDVVGGVAV